MITGLSRRLLGTVLDTLGWWRLVDLALSPEDVPRGCPWPDQVLAAMLRVGVADVQEAAYAGSTTSGIRCAKRAGARIVAGVLTGGHTRDRLREAGATHFITRITEFPALLAGAGADESAAGAPQARTPRSAEGPAGAPVNDVAESGLAGGAAREPGQPAPPQASASPIARQVP